MSLLGKNPAIKAFVAQFESEFLLAQVLIHRDGKKFLLRHVDDRGVETTSLRQVVLEDLRQLAQFTSAGIFRPLKSAPSLMRGWNCRLADEADLEFALNQIYPGAIADWFAAQMA